MNPASQAAAILAFLRKAPAPTDLLVLSHGWNNDIDDARLLYRTLLGSMRGLLDSPARGDGLAVLAVLWPSKKFAEASLIPGGGVASAGNADTSALAAKLERLKAGLPPQRAALIDEAKGVLGDLQNRRAARELFVDRLRRALERDPTGRARCCRAVLRSGPGGAVHRPGHAGSAVGAAWRYERQRRWHRWRRRSGPDRVAKPPV